MSRITTDLQKTLKDIEMKQLSETDGESQVQEAYNGFFKNYFKLTDDNRIKRICRCDAYFSKDGLSLLIEYKFDKDLKDTTARAKIIAQVIAYYKLILDENKVTIPNMVFVGDVNECFVFHINRINKFIALDGINWAVAPHDFGEKNPILVNAIVNDTDINEKIYISNPQTDDMEEICKNIISMSKGEYRFIAVNESTIRSAYDHFLKNVVREDLTKTSRKSSELVGLFIESIKDPSNRTIQNGMLQTPSYAAIKINEQEARRYYNHFGKRNDYEAKELSRFADFLEDDTERRFKGFFITPRPFVLYAYKLLEKYIGSNWASDYMVIDPCCGTKALTRELRFGELWLSSLDNAELNASKDVNKEWLSNTFQFDFLNDPIKKCVNISNALKQAAKNGKKVLFIMNPPYAQATSEQKKKSKKNVADTMVKQLMVNEGLGKASNELFVQFLFKIDDIRRKYKLKDGQIYIGTFSNPSWMCNESFDTFRTRWLSKWSYLDGFLFDASEFKGTSDVWGVSFSIWNNVPTEGAAMAEFRHTLVENNLDNITESLPQEIGEHKLYNIKKADSANKWAKGKLPKQFPCIGTSDGFEMRPAGAKGKRGETNCGTIAKNNLGYFLSNTDSVYKSVKYAGLFTTAITMAHGYSITSENFDRVCSLFSARRLVPSVWSNCKDSYCKPNTNHTAYAEFQQDAYIFSIFENQAKQTSVSGICGNENYDFKNQFYPFSKKDTYEMLGEDWLLNDKDEQRYILSAGKLNNLSQEGAACLDAYKACITASKNQRNDYNTKNPKYQLNRWDCGYFQQKGLFDESCPTEHKRLKECIKVLADKMRPLVYELGFLRH